VAVRQAMGGAGGVKLAGVEEAEEGGPRHGRKTSRSEAVARGPFRFVLTPLRAKAET
jgi:hypothetical protein